MNSFQRPTHSKDQVRITCKPFYLSPSNILKLKGQIVFYIFSSSFYFRILASTHTCNVILIVTACQNLKSENRTDKHVSNNFLYAAMNVLPIFSYLFLLHIYIYISLSSAHFLPGKLPNQTPKHPIYICLLQQC